MAKKKDEIVEEKQAEMLVYIGPKIKKGQINKIDTFKEIPKILEAEIKEYPALKSLFVPVSKFPEVKVKIAQGKGAYRSIIAEVIQRGY